MTSGTKRHSYHCVINTLCAKYSSFFFLPQTCHKIFKIEIPGFIFWYSYTSEFWAMLNLYCYNIFSTLHTVLYYLNIPHKIVHDSSMQIDFYKTKSSSLAYFRAENGIRKVFLFTFQLDQHWELRKYIIKWTVLKLLAPMREAMLIHLINPNLTSNDDKFVLMRILLWKTRVWITGTISKGEFQKWGMRIILIQKHLFIAYWPQVSVLCIVLLHYSILHLTDIQKCCVIWDGIRPEMWVVRENESLCDTLITWDNNHTSCRCLLTPT